MSNILHCPNVALNLLSVSQLADCGLDILFDSEKCVVKKRGTNQVVLRGNRVGDLYYYTRPSERALFTTSSNSVPLRSELFHRRMGHINYQDLKLLQHISEGVVLEKTVPDDCSCCVQAKSHRRHFQLSKSHSKRFGELTHSDVCYIGIESIVGDFTLFALFVDDATRYISIYLLRTKSDVTAAFYDYDAHVLNFTGRHCQFLRTDNGTEYFNQAVEAYCKRFGIIQQHSTVYTPQQNGRAERPNRSIVEGTSAMLLDSQLPLSFWGFAALAFVYLKNRSPHSALRRVTPYEAKYAKLPDLSHVRIFGSKCYVHVPQELRKGPGSKLAPKAKAMIFVGYSDVQKAWKLFDDVTGREVFSSEVYFQEQLVLQRTSSQCASSLSAAVAADSRSEDSAHLEQVPVEVDADAVANDVRSEVGSVSSLSNISSPLSISDDASDYGGEVSDNDSESSIDPLVATIVNAGDDTTDVDLAHLAQALLINIASEDTPTYAQAMSGPYRKEFLQAMEKEYKSLADNHVFSKPCQLPVGLTALDTKMVLKIKEAEHEGDARIFKARLCGKGFRQQFGIDYNETFAPVATYDSLRVFLTVAVLLDYEIDAIDVMIMSVEIQIINCY